MIDLCIRKATCSDLQQLQDISRITFCESFSDDNTEEDMKDYMEKSFTLFKLESEMMSCQSEFYFAISREQVIGYLKVNWGQSQSELRDDNTLEIERIYVLKAFQGLLAGRLLFEKALQIANEKCFDYIWLGVWEKNIKAITFYRKIGFVEFGKHVFLLGSDKQTDIMMKYVLNEK